MSEKAFRIGDLLPPYDTLYSSRHPDQRIKSGDVLFAVPSSKLTLLLPEDVPALLEVATLTRVKTCTVSNPPSFRPLVVDVPPNRRVVDTLRERSGVSFLSAEVPAQLEAYRDRILEAIQKEYGEEASPFSVKPGLDHYFPVRNIRMGASWNFKEREEELHLDFILNLQEWFNAAQRNVVHNTNTIQLDVNFDHRFELPVKDQFKDVTGNLDLQINRGPNVTSITGRHATMLKMFKALVRTCQLNQGSSADLRNFNEHLMKDPKTIKLVVELSSKTHVLHLGDNWIRFRIIDLRP